VSGRLAGFEPSVLNLPFSEESLMHSFKCETGYTGIHADLAAIEPCVIAHYSEDEALLKVYKDGLGDIYLDLALELFPENKELKEAYNPNVKLDSSLKTRFADLRGIAKTIHLAVSYTGSYITVGKNLNKAGFPTTPDRARLLVKRYWTKFHKVSDFNHRLKFVYDKEGFVRNLVGRIVKVPVIFKKDLMNRLIQSSAHDILVKWVMNIEKLVKEEGVDMKPILPDVHDSTSWQVIKGQTSKAKEIFQKSLTMTEQEVQLSVPIKAEIKYFETFAGLKGEE
jgi:DNA polymerase-1